MNQVDKKPEENAEEIKQRQTKQLHKVEQDLLKSEIESMVQELAEIKKTDGEQKRSNPSQDGSQKGVSQRSGIS